jgi:hypothetical protein
VVIDNIAESMEAKPNDTNERDGSTSEVDQPNRLYQIATNGQVEAILMRLDKPDSYEELVSYLQCSATRAYFNRDTGSFKALWVFANAVAADDWRIVRFVEVANLVADTLPGDNDDLPELPDEEFVGENAIVDLDDPAVVDHLRMIIDEAPAQPVSPPADDDVPLRGVTNIRNELWAQQFPPRMVNGRMTGGGAGPKLLYFALIGHCGRRNWCLVGNERLATDTSSSDRSVQRWMEELTEAGLVKRTPHQYKNLNRYELPHLKTIDFKKAKQVWRERRATT